MCEVVAFVAAPLEKWVVRGRFDMHEEVDIHQGKVGIAPSLSSFQQRKERVQVLEENRWNGRTQVR